MSPKTEGEVDESHSSRFYWIMRLTDNEKGNMSRLYINTKMHENIIFVTIYKCDWSLPFWQEIWLDLVQKTYFSLFFFFFFLSSFTTEGEKKKSGWHSYTPGQIRHDPVLQGVISFLLKATAQHIFLEGLQIISPPCYPLWMIPYSLCVHLIHPFKLMQNAGDPRSFSLSSLTWLMNSWLIPSLSMRWDILWYQVLLIPAACPYARWLCSYTVTERDSQPLIVLLNTAGVSFTLIKRCPWLIGGCM